MKTFIAILIVVAVLFGGSVWYSRSHTGSDVIATQGIHWHPELKIFVDGKEMTIPQHIGLGGSEESPIHTHEDLPLIHLEFPGIVRKSDITLGKFFQVWGKDFHSFGPNVTMTVNGVPNTEYENYVMHDGDKIVLNYTTSISTAATSTQVK